LVPAVSPSLIVGETFVDPFGIVAPAVTIAAGASTRSTEAMSKEALRAFTALLREWRTESGATQEQMADTLVISRKTYVLFESSRWLPPMKEQAFTLKILHALDPALAEAFLAALDATVEDFAIPLAPHGADAAAELPDEQAKAAYDAAVYSTAEQFDMSPKAMRAIVTTLLEKMSASKLSMRKAAALAKAPR
jgi:DNA-binding XRE family transcriptional regulator